MGVYVKLACVAGLLISVYALWIEHQVMTRSNYLALCDLHQYASCSRVLSSKYSKGFGIIGPTLGDESPLNQPNCLYGILFFLIYLTLDTISQSFFVKQLKFTLSASSIVMSLYLAYILAFVLVDLCLICLATYVVNIGLAVPAFENYFAALDQQQKNSEKKD
ncbi:hypothetical protein ACHWQZ_G012413 [Mnemiopsis leidyi]